MLVLVEKLEIDVEAELDWEEEEVLVLDEAELETVIGDEVEEEDVLVA